MTLYKQAQQIQFAHESELKTELGRIRDAEYSEYISVLSQIHVDLQQDASLSLEEAIAKHVESGYYQKKILNLISQIGLATFRGTPFQVISTSLSELRTPTTKELPGATIPEPSRLGTEGQMILKRFRSIEFPEHRKLDAERMISVLEEMYLALESGRLTDKETRNLRFEIADTVATLEGFAEEVAPPVEEPPAEILEEEEEELLEIKKPEEPPTAGTLIQDESDLKEQEEVRKEAVSILADLTSEKVMEHPIFAGVDKLFDFSVVPPEINVAAYQESYDRVLNYFGALNQRANQVMSIDGPSASAKMLKEFNNLIFALKTVDRQAIFALEEFKKQKLAKPEELVAISNKLYNVMFTFKIRDDDELFDNVLFTPLVYMANYGLSRILAGKKNLRSIALEQFDESDVTTAASSATRDLLKSRFDKVLDISHESYMNAINDTIASIRLKVDLIVKNTVQNLSGKRPVGRVSWCSTCFRKIDWSYSKEVVSEIRTARGFQIPIYSVFAQTKTGVQSITEEMLTRDTSDGKVKERLFEPPSANDYQFDEDRQVVASYKGAKTWAQIKQLLNSNNFTEQEEGWHRRATAFKSLGGRYLGRRMIRDIMTKCPYPSAKVSCGVSFDPVSPELGGSSFNLQPKTSNAIDRSYQWNTKHAAGWEENKLAEEANNKTRGGYKFSKISFGCPCHITNIDNETSSKHFYMAIPLTGAIGYSAEGYQPPTSPDGMLSEELLTSKGTSAYLVCGAPTSLSAFDRNLQSDTYVIRFLIKLREENPRGFVEVTEELIKNGVELLDVMQMIDVMEAEPVAREAKLRRIRMTKIAILLAEAAARTTTPAYEHLKDLTLVCPFGHKFTIGQSLGFGNSHSAITVRNNFKSFSSALRTTGKNNVQALHRLGVFVPATDVIRPNAVRYEEWIQRPYAERNLDDLLLTIPDENGDPKDYFISNTNKPRKNIWREDKSYDPMIVTEYTYEGVSREKEVSSFVQNSESGAFDKTDFVAAQNYQQREQSDVLAEPIPGADEEDINTRIASLGRAVQAVLKIINIWTTRIADMDMAKALLITPNIDFVSHSRRVVEIFREKIIFYDEEEELVGDLVPESEISKLSNMVSTEFSRNVKLVGLFHTQEMTDDIAVAILATSMLSAVNKAMEGGDVDIDIDSELDEYFEQIAKAYLKNTPDLIDQVLHRGRTDKDIYVKRAYTSRVFLVGYAQYMADALVRLHDEFFSKDSLEFYIGYDIGVDLSSRKSILSLTEQDAALVTMSVDKLPRRVVGLSIAERIDLAYHKLMQFLERARDFSVTPSALNEAREYIVENISRHTGEDAEEIGSIFNATFPVSSMSFDYNLNSESFIPFPSKTKPIPKLKGTVRHKDVPVIDKEGRQVVDKDGNPIRKSFFQNDAINYDGSKFQIGMIGPKPSVLPWPPPEGGYTDGFVGVVLPFPATSSFSKSDASDIPIVDASVIVDIEGEPVDITFLFNRGRSQEQVELASEIEANMMYLVRQYNEDIRRLNPEEKDAYEKRFRAELRVLHSELQKIPLRIRTKQSYAKATGNIETGKVSWKGEPYPAITLVDPVRAMEILSKPYLIVPDPKFVPQLEKIKEFIIHVYALDKVQEVVSVVLKKQVSIDDLFRLDNIINNMDMSDPQREKIKRKIQSTLQNKSDGWTNEIGRYYDIIPKSIDDSQGSYIQYLYSAYPSIEKSKRQEGKYTVVEESYGGDVPAPVNLLISRLKNFIDLGLLNREQQSSLDLISKAQEGMIEYVRTATEGGMIVEANDDTIKNSYYLKKIAKRHKELERIIMRMGLEHLDPDYLLNK